MVSAEDPQLLLLVATSAYMLTNYLNAAHRESCINFI